MSESHIGRFTALEVAINLIEFGLDFLDELGRVALLGPELLFNQMAQRIGVLLVPAGEKRWEK